MGIENIDELKPGYEDLPRKIKKIETPGLKLHGFEYLGPQGNPPRTRAYSFKPEEDWAGKGYTGRFQLEDPDPVHDDPAVD